MVTTSGGGGVCFLEWSTWESFVVKEMLYILILERVIMLCHMQIFIEWCTYDLHILLYTQYISIKKKKMWA